MYCKNCGEQMNDNQAVCLKCGVKTGEGNAYCQNCGQPTAPEASFCIHCGVALHQQKQSAEKTYAGFDKITMALLCFFLGGIGVHNFLMGETKKGIVKIALSCCCGIGGILALIDFIRILTDSYTVNPEDLF